MKKTIHQAQLGLRRGVLGLILLVPDEWRARLARSEALAGVYRFFDKAKYDDPSGQRPLESPTQAPPARPARHFAPLGEYDYQSPKLTAEIAAAIQKADGPLFSILVPVYNTDPKWLRAAIQSVEDQWYGNWELCIVDDASDREDTLDLLASLQHPKIRVSRLDKNQHIAAASNAALAMARGAYIALLDHDDELTPDALYRAWKTIEDTGAEFIYSDEDKLDEEGQFCDVHFKPDFSPDQFLAHNYLCHFAVMQRDLALAVDGFTEGTEGAQDYDLFLKVAEHTNRIAHIPRVLYHWRKVPGSTAAVFSHKSYAQDAGQIALEHAVTRRGLDAAVIPGAFPGTYRVRYTIENNPLVSIVIPFKDRPDLLESCLDSIMRSTWQHFEVIGVSNNSETPETFEAMRRWSERDTRIRFVEHNVPFNFSALNNFAVREHARGKHVLMLNNDIEIINEDWIESLLEFSQRPDVGVVGARLYYPDGTIQHAGVILGIDGVAAHSHKHIDREHGGYFCRPHVVQNLSAVTAACCMVKRSVWDRLGGLDETRFRIAFNDTDFCLRARELGLLNVYTPYCEAWHHESVSRGYEDTPEKLARFEGEIHAFRERHAEALATGDPYYNPHFSMRERSFHLASNWQSLDPSALRPRINEK